jgi:hypothetical protein
VWVAVTGRSRLACAVVDARRNYPQDPGGSDPAGRWYSDDRGYGEEQDRSATYGGQDPFAPGSYDSYRSSYGDSTSAGLPGPVGPRSGEPLPTDTGGVSRDELSRHHRSEAIDRDSLRRPANPANPAYPAQQSAPPAGPPYSAPPVQSAPPAPSAALSAPTVQTSTGSLGGSSVYAGKRPGLATLLVVLTIVFEIPVLRLFVTAVFAGRPDAGDTIAGIFMIPALPTFAFGLYGLIGGAAATQGGRAWLRAPLAYLPIGLLLFVSAALAAR